MLFGTKEAAAGILAVAVSVLAPGWACAQVAGTYQGSAADGSGVTLVVSTDAATGVLAVTSATVFFNAPCKGAAYTLSTGWGYGFTADIVNRKASNVTISGYFDIAFTADFSANGKTAKGTVSAISPTLYPLTGTKPTKALYCTSPKQDFTLSFVPPAGADALPRAPHYFQ